MWPNNRSWRSRIMHVTYLIPASRSSLWLDTRSNQRYPAILRRDMVPKELSLCFKHPGECPCVASVANVPRTDAGPRPSGWGPLSAVLPMNRSGRFRVNIGENKVSIGGITHWPRRQGQHEMACASSLPCPFSPCTLCASMGAQFVHSSTMRARSKVASSCEKLCSHLIFTLISTD